MNLDKKAKIISTSTLVIVLAAVIAYCLFIQLYLPNLYGTDGYYHIKVASFLRDFGLNYNFRWAQFSTFKDSFSDKDLIFHLLTIPFLYLSDDLVTSAKYANIFFIICFLLTYLFVLKKYLPNFLVACFLLLPFFSRFFTIYLSFFRPATLANIFTILGIYFIIHKRWIKLAFIALFYPLTHLSFPTLIFFALVCEVIRYKTKKEFFFRNIYIVVIASLVACIIHPNSPNNWVSIYLNAILVPVSSSILGKALDFGKEFSSSSARIIFTDNFAVFFSLNLCFWLAFIGRRKLSLSTLTWWCCSCLYLVFSFFSDRYWYQANILFFIFFASYLKDYMEGKTLPEMIPKIRIILLFYLTVPIIFAAYTLNYIKSNVAVFAKMNAHYETVGKWMNKNIPEGETIYHAYWSDSPYFICFNPKNNYMVTLDPIYMFAPYPKKYVAYQGLIHGKGDPYQIIKGTFGLTYGYTRNNNKLYKHIKAKENSFQILYEDHMGTVFKLL
jgi:hypothetical protein